MLWAYEHANRNSIHYVFYMSYFIVFHFLVGMMLASLATGIILESYVVTRGLEREEEVRHENEALGNEADDLRESWHDHSRRLEEHMYRGDLAEVEAEEMRALGSLTEELGMQDMNELQAVRQRHASIAALHTQHSIWYKLTVKTADMRGAGTQASVSVRLRGHAHHSELHHLHHSHGERAFGRGATDTFLVASPHDLGELAEIHVEMDGAGKTSAWYETVLSELTGYCHPPSTSLTTPCPTTGCSTRSPSSAPAPTGGGSSRTGSGSARRTACTAGALRRLRGPP